MILMLIGAAGMGAYQFGGPEVRRWQQWGMSAGVLGFALLVLGFLLHSSPSGDCAAGYENGGSYEDC